MSVPRSVEEGGHGYGYGRCRGFRTYACHNSNVPLTAICAGSVAHRVSANHIVHPCNASLVQMVEIILKKISPPLYQALGIFLPLITTNCAVLGVAILVIQKQFSLIESVVYAFSTAIGFALALIVFAGLREQLALTNVPKGMRGMSIVLITAGLLSLAFMGFSGVDNGLKAIFGN